MQGTSIQLTASKGIFGTIEVEPEYAEGLKDIEGFSHLILIYHFCLSKGYSLTVLLFFGDSEQGLFATRASSRPNPLRMSIVRLRKVGSKRLEVEDVDIVDETPLLDSNPYVPELDTRTKAKSGCVASRRGRMRRWLLIGDLSSSFGYPITGVRHCWLPRLS